MRVQQAQEQLQADVGARPACSVLQALTTQGFSVGPHTLQALALRFDLHPLTVEDCVQVRCSSALYGPGGTARSAQSTSAQSGQDSLVAVLVAELVLLLRASSAAPQGVLNHAALACSSSYSALALKYVSLRPCQRALAAAATATCSVPACAHPTCRHCSDC